MCPTIVFQSRRVAYSVTKPESAVTLFTRSTSIVHYFHIRSIILTKLIIFAITVSFFSQRILIVIAFFFAQVI